MRLYLVRHGQSEGNVAKTFHGHTDYPLTELGREQARQAGEKLKDTAFVRCVASDLSRAWDTALSCVAGRGMIPERCPGLREQFVGEMEGLSWDEMDRRYPGVREAYISDWFHTTPPGGESPEEMARRVGDCVDEIVGRGEDTLLVAHNGSLSLVLAHLGIAGEKELLHPGWFFQQGCYTALDVTGGKGTLLGFNL